MTNNLKINPFMCIIWTEVTDLHIEQGTGDHAANR